LPGVPARVAAGWVLGAGAGSVEGDVEDDRLLPAADAQVLQDVVNAAPLVEVPSLWVGEDVAVADPADLVPIPAGGLRGVAVKGEVALEEDLVGIERLGREVVADPPEDHVEVAVPPEVVAGQLLREDFAVRRPEVAQFVGGGQG